METDMAMRYLQIADYPGSASKIGDILYDSSPFHRLADFPNLFRELKWWESLHPSEVPKYIRFAGRINPVKFEYRVTLINLNCEELNSEYAKDFAWMLDDRFQPATEQEYEARRSGVFRAGDFDIYEIAGW